MCTVSVVPLVGGFSLACNRDELLLRPIAVPPAWCQIGEVRATFPVDPAGGGTWVAASESGLALALLNRHSIDSVDEDVRAAATRVTRGEIIPRLLASTRLTGVGDQLQRLDPARYAPFQLVAIYGRGLLIATSNGRALSVTTNLLREPVMFTSSSLGDRDARRVRQPLFDSLVRRASHPVEGQRQFHDHQWPGCPSFSVRMRRPNARTVSRSIVVVHKRRTSFTYEALDV